MKPLTECENCASIWSVGTDEYDFQKCSSCGWSPGDPLDEDDEDFWAEDNWDEDDDRDNPNDSRNI